MGDPEGACTNAKQAFKPDGWCMVVELFADDSIAENLNPIDRAFYAFSTRPFTSASLSSTRRILPLTVFGSSVTNSIFRGYL